MKENEYVKDIVEELADLLGFVGEFRETWSHDMACRIYRAVWLEEGEHD